MTQINLLRQVKNLNFPEGFLINWQIVTSVNSWHLTVALKTLAWTDPSVTDPVHCRIGWVIRTITSALSVNLNAGTNWNNMWSSELATKEVDNFVYLWYSTSESKINIWFSRIPYWALISDFNNVIDTNEKSFARGWAFNTTDQVVNIWRFNAILSAWPGYTWSIGTSVIINRPVYETRRLEYIPIISWSWWWSASWESKTWYYKIIWTQCYVDTTWGFTKNTLAWKPRISLPFSSNINSENITTALLWAVNTRNNTQLLDPVLNNNANYIEWLNWIWIAWDWSTIWNTLYFRINNNYNI